MQRQAFKMKLREGFREEYRKRHDAIWPELVSLLKSAGISDYSIFLDEETLTLFAVWKLTAGNTTDALPREEVMRKWWDYMADIMETMPDHSPVSIPLPELFRLD